MPWTTTFRATTATIPPLYAISHAGVTVTHLDSLEEVDSVQLVTVEPTEPKTVSEEVEAEDSSEE